MKVFKKLFLYLCTTSLLTSGSLSFAGNDTIVSGTSSTGKSDESIHVPQDLLQSETAGFRIRVVAIRELNEFSTSALAISYKFWPKLRIVCDGVVKDESTAIVLKPVTTLRIAVSADVTGCRAVTIEKPADPEGVNFSSNNSKLEWYVIGIL